MESHPPPQHPFSRQCSQTTLPKSPFLPIPPPPYSSSMIAPQTELLHRNDPFLRRRTASSASVGQAQSYTAAHPSHYQPNPLTGLQPSSGTDPLAQSGRDGQQILYGGRKDGQYQAQPTKGTSFVLSSELDLRVIGLLDVEPKFLPLHFICHTRPLCLIPFFFVVLHPLVFSSSFLLRDACPVACAC